MNCSTAPDRPSSENITPEETAGAVANGVGQLDLDRASAYAGLTSLRGGQSEAYTREEKLLARKYGDQHPRVLAVAQRRAANEVLRRDLAVAHAIAATPPPQTDPTTYSFHGHIRDCDRKPLAQLTVGLYSARGEYLSSLGYGCSDEDGYFLLRGTPPPNADGAETVATVRVYDANQKLLHTECEPVRVAPGRSDYREIIICGDVCPPPPGDPGDPPPAPLTVPDVVGKKEATAKAQLEKAGFAVESLTRGAEEEQVGFVLEQRPTGGSKAAQGTVVAIVVGTALPKVAVPDVVGRSLREAQAILANANLTTGNIQPAGASLQSPVVQQAPAAGTQVAPGSAVDLVVRPPVEKITVPQVIRRSLGEARRMILDAGLTVGKIKPAGASDTNIVTDQAPAAGTEVDRGTAIDLAVAESPKVTVPKVVGLKLAEAKQVLERARLTVGKINPTDAGSSFVVAKQSPEAGSQAAEGSAVDLDLRSPNTRSMAAPKARSRAKKDSGEKETDESSQKQRRRLIVNSRFMTARAVLPAEPARSHTAPKAPAQSPPTPAAAPSRDRTDTAQSHDGCACGGICPRCSEHSAPAQGRGESPEPVETADAPAVATTPDTPDAIPAQSPAPAAPPAVSSLSVNVGSTGSSLVHVPACGTQPTITFTAGPAAAVPITWAVAAGTAALDPGTTLLSPAPAPGAANPARGHAHRRPDPRRRPGRGNADHHRDQRARRAVDDLFVSLESDRDHEHERDQQPRPLDRLRRRLRSRLHQRRWQRRLAGPGRGGRALPKFTEPNHGHAHLRDPVRRFYPNDWNAPGCGQRRRAATGS